MSNLPSLLHIEFMLEQLKGSKTPQKPSHKRDISKELTDFKGIQSVDMKTSICAYLDIYKSTILF